MNTARSRFRATWSCACTIPNWVTTRAMPSSSGRLGDFYTSSDVHAVFGRLLARQFEEIWRAFGSPAEIEILELGPGRGLFAQDVLAWSEKKFLSSFGLCTTRWRSSLPNCGRGSGTCLPDFWRVVERPRFQRMLPRSTTTRGSSPGFRSAEGGEAVLRLKRYFLHRDSTDQGGRDFGPCQPTPWTSGL